MSPSIAQNKPLPAEARTVGLERTFGEGSTALEVLEPQDPDQAAASLDQMGWGQRHEPAAENEFAVQDKYSCITERPLPAQLIEDLRKTTDEDGLADIVLGLYGKIPRWQSRVTVNWAAYAGGYPAAGDALYAAIRLDQAGRTWNSKLDGLVTFKWVNNIKDAAFVLAYGGDKGSVLASAFFPNAADLNTLFVYKSAVQNAAYKAIQNNIFQHELGHVLGLRHEFAPEKEAGTGAIVYGARNPKSVMSYVFPPTIQDSDVEQIKKFYNDPSYWIQGLPVARYIPD